MNATKHLKLLVLLVGLTYAGIARSDIVLVDAVSLCGFRISNVDDYPKIALVAVRHNKGSNDDQRSADKPRVGRMRAGSFTHLI